VYFKTDTAGIHTSRVLQYSSTTTHILIIVSVHAPMQVPRYARIFHRPLGENLLCGARTLEFYARKCLDAPASCSSVYDHVLHQDDPSQLCTHTFGHASAPVVKLNDHRLPMDGPNNAPDGARIVSVRVICDANDVVRHTKHVRHRTSTVTCNCSAAARADSSKTKCIALLRARDIGTEGHKNCGYI
jgi:hypothetical protein